MVLVGAQETTANRIAYGVICFAENPDQTALNVHGPASLPVEFEAETLLVSRE